jgi:hypothetical protein
MQCAFRKGGVNDSRAQSSGKKSRWLAQAKKAASTTLPTKDGMLPPSDGQGTKPTG